MPNHNFLVYLSSISQSGNIPQLFKTVPKQSVFSVEVLICEI
jgi:hypothetical protein